MRRLASSAPPRGFALRMCAVAATALFDCSAANFGSLLSRASSSSRSRLAPETLKRPTEASWVLCESLSHALEPNVLTRTTRYVPFLVQSGSFGGLSRRSVGKCGPLPGSLPYGLGVGGGSAGGLSG